MNNSNDIPLQDRLQLLLLSQQHIHENIKFADQKSAALVLANGALLTTTFNLISPGERPTAILPGLIVCTILSIAIAVAFWVVKPRGEKNRARGVGVIDSIRISLFSHEQFLAQIAKIQDHELLEELRTFVYDRAVIDKEKYFILQVALLISFVGWTAALAFAVWVRLF